jgi:penicillin-binding protein 2
MSRFDSFQDPYRLKRLFKQRTLLVLALVCFLFVVLLYRLIYLQVVEHKYYTTLALNNSISLVPLPPTRGLIYDRNGVLLASNIAVYNLNIIPDKVPDIAATIYALKKFIALTPTDIEAFYHEKNQKRAFESVPLKVNLSAQDVAKFMVNRYQFPGVDIKAALIRHYPFANDLAPVLGYVGRINENDLLNVDPSNYAATNYIGKIGIENYFESQLHGQVGYQQIETDATGQQVRVLKRTPPLDGKNLYLTIDSKLQEAALKAMHDYRGALVAIQPSTGQVLALVSTPSYNPNLFVNGISNQQYHALQTSKQQPLFNRAIRGQYPFGSTIKVFYSLAGLAGGFTTPDFTIYDPGFYKIGGHVFHDEAKNIYVNLEKALEVSSDTYFYRLSLKMGITVMDNVLHDFGFGQYTNIQMKEELPGLVASPAWKLKTRGHRWFSGDTLNSSIGQGAMLTTPVQLASATAAMAEHGKRFQPTLLYKSTDGNGSVYQPIPTPLSSVIVKASYWNTVIQGMINVIRGPQGTGWRFGKPPYSVAAKTGTAQVYSLRGAKYILANVPKRLRDNSLFIAFAPVKNPQIAIAVVVQGASMAPKVAREVMDYYLLPHNNMADNKH